MKHFCNMGWPCGIKDQIYIFGTKEKVEMYKTTWQNIESKISSDVMKI